MATLWCANLTSLILQWLHTLMTRLLKINVNSNCSFPKSKKLKLCLDDEQTMPRLKMLQYAAFKPSPPFSVPVAHHFWGGVVTHVRMPRLIEKIKLLAF